MWAPGDGAMRSPQHHLVVLLPQMHKVGAVMRKHWTDPEEVFRNDKAVEV